MKKTLAIAIAAGLAAPMAVMADTTLYGSIHESLDMVDTGAANGDNISVSNNKSYLGVKGSEKISDGLKAVYKIEFGPTIGDGGTLGNRDQYVGLSGNYGTAIIGRASTPYKIVAAKADLFWFSQLGSNRNADGFDRRSNDVIAYFTPKMGGFSAAIATITEDQGNNASDNYSGNMFYKAGGLMVGLGLEKTDASDVDTRLMASYDTGKVKVVGFAEDKNETGSVNDRDIYGIGASVKTAKGVVKGQYYVNSGQGSNNDASLFALGYDHKLSKRTTIYAQYASMDNEANTQFGLGGVNGSGGGTGHSEPHAAASAGQDVSGISLGIKHDF